MRKLSVGPSGTTSCDGEGTPGEASGPRTGPGVGAAVPGRPAGFPGGGGKSGDAVTVDVGEPQLGAGARAFAAGDHPHALRPRRQVEQAGQLGEPRAAADLAVAVLGRRPRPGGDLADRLGAVQGCAPPAPAHQRPPGLPLRPPDPAHLAVLARPGFVKTASRTQCLCSRSSLAIRSVMSADRTTR